MEMDNIIVTARLYSLSGNWSEVLQICRDYFKNFAEASKVNKLNADENEELALLEVKSVLAVMPYAEMVVAALEKYTFKEENAKLINLLKVCIIDCFKTNDNQEILSSKYLRIFETVTDILMDEFGKVYEKVYASIGNDITDGTGDAYLNLTMGLSMIYTEIVDIFQKEKFMHSIILDEPYDFRKKLVEFEEKRSVDSYNKSISLIELIKNYPNNYPYFYIKSSEEALKLNYLYKQAIYLSIIAADFLIIVRICSDCAYIQRLKYSVDLICQAMNAHNICSNGNEVDIIFDQDKRDYYFTQITKYETEIKKYDSAYTHPNVKRIGSMAEYEAVQQSKSDNNSGGNCYIATCVYGSYNCPQVWVLRRFRDNILARTWYGKAFIHEYYAISPTLVKWFGNTNWFQKFWKSKLDILIKKLMSNGIDNTPYKDNF